MPTTLLLRLKRSLVAAALVAAGSLFITAAIAQGESQDYLVTLAGRTFDPAQIEAALSPETALSSDARAALRQQPGHYLMQLQQPLTAELRSRLIAQYGLDLSEYVPNLTYVERLSPETVARLNEDGNIRVVVPFQPAFKLSPTIGQLEPRTEERARVKGLLLRAILFDSAEPQEVASAVRQLGGLNISVRDDREIGGVARLQFVLPDAGALALIARISDVRWVEEVGELIEDNVNAATTIQSGTAGTGTIWNNDLHGEGQIIGIIDSGPPDINHCFFRDPVNNTPSLVHRKVLEVRNGAGQAAGGHATFTAGNAAGNDFNLPGAAPRRGGAWAARLVAGTTADVSSNTLLFELTAASNRGAVIHTNSWHDNTAGAGNPATYNQNAADVDTFTWNNEDQIVFGSMGNNGEEQGPPGTAKNAVGVNAARANAMNIGDGNPGPTADGRRKPDLATVGCNIQSATFNTACTVGPRAACATSYATPHAAAAAALVRQYFAEGLYPTGTRKPDNAFLPSGALVKAVLINGTVDMSGVAGYPAANEGWGVVRLDNSLFFPGDPRNLRVWDYRQANGLTTGESRNFRVTVADAGEPLRITLAWSDPPGAAGAANPVVNDLDLEVTTPDGTQLFRGNVFAGGVSTTGGAADTLNTVEMVVVNNPPVGEWQITVSGSTVAVGNPGQGFALVATGDFPDKPRFEYAAKVVCGPQTEDLDMRLARGFYATTVNIHNPGKRSSRIFKKLALSYPPEEQRPGEVLPIGYDTLRYDEALKTDCNELQKLFHDGFPTPYVEGFVVIQSTESLDVTAVYSTAQIGGPGAKALHSSIDVERVAERNIAVDLRIRKNATVFSFPITDNYTIFAILYEVNVGNTGAQIATNIRAEDSLLLQTTNAVGLLAVLATPIDLPPGGQILNIVHTPPDAASFQLELGDLDPGNTLTARFWVLSLVYETGNPATAFMRNTISVESDEAEMTPANNQTIINTQLLP